MRIRKFEWCYRLRLNQLSEAELSEEVNALRGERIAALLSYIPQGRKPKKPKGPMTVSADGTVLFDSPQVSLADAVIAEMHEALTPAMIEKLRQVLEKPKRQKKQK